MTVIPPQPPPKPHYIAVDPQNQSAIQGLYSRDLTQYLKVTKFTLQKFLEACVRADGQFRKFFDRFATFTGDFVVNENLDADPTKRHLQIARFFKGTREQPPQIFIQDAGYRYKPSSLGGLAAGFNQRTAEGHQIVRITDVIEVPVEFSIVATDEQLCEDLQALLTAAFHPSFLRWTSSWVLRPPRTQVVTQNAAMYWEVRIPLDHEMTAKTHSPFHDDNNDRFWESRCTMTVDFENSVFITYKAAPRFNPKPGSLKILTPDRISIRRSHRIALRDLKFPFRIYSDDHRIAIVEQTQTHFVIHPRRLGKFRIVVAREGGTELEGNILGRKEIEVVAR